MRANLRTTFSILYRAKRWIERMQETAEGGMTEPHLERAMPSSEESTWKPLET